MKLANCLQVILNAGWSVSKDNWEEVLEISGVAAVRTQYWDTFNTKRDEILAKDIEKLNKDFLNSSIYTKEERELIKK